MRQPILIFGHGYATQFIDISNQYTKLFDPTQFEVTVAYLKGEPDEKIRQRHLAENIYFLNASKSMTRGLKIAAIKKMLQLQKKNKFQIVICHRYKPSYIMLWVAQFCRIPNLFFVMHELKTLSSFSRKCIVALLAKKNMFFAGVSNAVRDDIRGDIWRVPAERVITLYNMIDIELTKPTFLERSIARAKLNLREENFVFGTLGRLVKAKDQTTLINGFALIKTQCPQAKLVIMGHGILEEKLRKQIQQLNLEDEVILTGYIHQGFTLLKALDVFVLTSIKEAFGRVLLEAMLANVPVIATKINGIPEVIGDAGILIDAMNPPQLGEKMQMFYHLPQMELKKWANKGRCRAEQNFSLQRFNEIFWELPLASKKTRSVI
ncbi:MAG: pglJ [Gammaproteobacteria bacterium]|jgi:glycosyltransferase involved in cell wall biosynthesis|nr:pglJ [Gammaproteobacteria bacterium]